MMLSFVALLSIVAAQVPPKADQDPPIIEDVAAASSNPMAAPVITVLLSDRGSGVGAAAVYYRAVGHGDFAKAELKGGTSGLFIARLPDGLQNTGFEYYIEASDLSGNGPARIASATAPIKVEKAVEPTMKRIERQKQGELLDAQQVTSIHPGWVMLSLGIGVLAGAGAGAYTLDAVGTQAQLEPIQERLQDPTLTESQRAGLQSSADSFETALFQDTVIASVLGVIAAAGLATGTVLLVVSATE